MSISFADLRASNAARQAEWDSGSELSITFKSTELAGEIGEGIEAVLDILGLSAALAVAGSKAGNIVKKMERARLGMKGSHATADDLAQELADILVCVDLLADAAGIDLSPAVVAKFNGTSEKYGLATRFLVPRRVRHINRGSFYDVLGQAEGQISTGTVEPNARIVREGDEITVYRASNGRLFWRFPDEFEDGRFEPAL